MFIAAFVLGFAGSPPTYAIGPDKMNLLNPFTADKLNFLQCF
jgi:hypothetical protein